MSAFALPGPLSVQVDTTDYGGPALWLALTALGEALCIDDRGNPRFVQLHEITVDWRYDWSAQEWVTVDGVGYVEENVDDDGSPDLPGSVQYPDGAGDGDPLDAQGEPTTGDPGDVDANAQGIR